MTVARKGAGRGARRPPSVTAVAWLFITAGTIGVAYHAEELSAAARLAAGPLLVLSIRLLAIAGGVFLLRGAGWARWLLILWMAYHTALGAAHGIGEFLTHAVLLALIAYVLLRPAASAYFRPTHEAPGFAPRA